MSNNTMNSFSHWIYPLLFAVSSYFVVRMVTDIPLHNTIVPANHVVGIGWALFMSYAFYFACRFYYSKRWSRNSKGVQLLKEFLEVILSLLIITNFAIVCSNLFVPIIDLKDKPAGGIVIVNTICIAFSLLYYTMIRSQWIGMNQEVQLEKIKRDQINTELELLKARYHPHFLFNALNTIYFQMEETAHPAKETIGLLSGLLRYQLYEVNRKVAISQEIAYLRTFIRFQQIRTSDRLQLHTFFDPALQKQQIHPLLFQPLVENAFKYLGGAYKLSVEMEWKEGHILFRVENSVPTSLSTGCKRQTGIGIENLRRRLALLYPKKHELHISPGENTFCATLILQPEE